MRTVVSAEEMQRCDTAAMRSFGLRSIVLMENAGAGTAHWIIRRYGAAGKQIAIFCGKGNNGGDGFVTARHLANAGAHVTVFLLERPSKGDAATNAAIVERMSRSMPARLMVKPYSPSSVSSSRPEILVDAMFGTGFSGSAKGKYRSAIEYMNRQKVPRVSIDIPSGVNGTTGLAEGPAISATETLTLGALKSGLLCNQGRDMSGSVTVLDIGIPESIITAVRPQTILVDREDVRPMLPRKSSTVHKYSAGKVFVLAGSKGFTGAAALAAESALRAGAGAVVLGTPVAVYEILARKLTEVIVEPFPSTESGSLGRAGLDPIMKRMEWADAIVLGPGVSRNDETGTLIRQLVRNARGNLLLDADALNILADDGLALLKQKRDRCVLTPHTGEFSRLTHIPSEKIELRRIEHARALSKKINTMVVLKGAPTVVAVPDGRVFLNSTGNPGMATVGTGDVLAGLIAGLWAQGIGSLEASLAGVYLHGFAGDIASEAIGQKSLLAGDLIRYLPDAFQRVEVAR